MLMGAFAAFFTTLRTGSLALGLAGGGAHRGRSSDC